MSDNPGLLPMASENYGLGHSFLRSIERSLALVYVLDLTRANPEKDLVALRQELEAYKAGLASKGRVVIVNKGDDVDEVVGRQRLQHINEQVEALRRDHAEELDVITVSAKYGLGLAKVVTALARHVEYARRNEGGDDETASSR
jgi:GTP-binding protein